jgi:2-methylisocitrate lyase-like PEP mutase family enzyme
MASQSEKAELFLELHRPGQPLLMPNAWDNGSARLLVSLGFEALATTSSGHAASLGRLDGSVTREEALMHATALVDATDVPVSADLENAFADHSEGVAETIRGALDTGLAGCSIEDFDGKEIYALDTATARVASAVEAAHAGPVHLVLTARAENHIRGNPDLGDTIARLRSYEMAGADVLYAPGLSSGEDIARVVDAVQRPVNVLAVRGGPPVAELAELGVSRVSVGGAFAFAAMGALVRAGRELREQGTYAWSELSADGLRAVRDAFPKA